MNWKNVEMPDRIKALPKDQRGYPIPFVVLRDDDDMPNFQLDSARRISQCMVNVACGVCGQPLENEIWFLGNYLRALSPSGFYIDSPLHKQCGTYALKVCPFLAAPSYNKMLSSEKLNKEKYEGTQFRLSTQVTRFSSLFAFVKTAGYRIDTSGSFPWHVYPDRPFLEMEYWQHGKQLTGAEADKLLRTSISSPV